MDIVRPFRSNYMVKAIRILLAFKIDHARPHLEDGPFNFIPSVDANFNCYGKYNYQIY